MVTRKKELLPLVLAALLCCGIMAVVDGILKPGYALKSAIKLCVFGAFPVILSRLCRMTPMGCGFNPWVGQRSLVGYSAKGRR